MDRKKFETYVQNAGPGVLFPHNVTKIAVADLYRLPIQGLSTSMYFFTLVHALAGEKFRDDFVLRIYKDHDERKCLREYMALKYLRSKDISVPNAFVLETDTRIIGRPFMIMERICGTSASHFFRSRMESSATVDALAKVLASVHKLDPSNIPDGCWICKQYLQRRLERIRNRVSIEYLSSLSPSLRRRFLDAIKRLEAVKIRPFRKALVHGDFGPDHVIMTQRGPFIVDWEGITIDDPACDVGWTYHTVMLEGHKMIDHRFVRSERQEISSLDVPDQFVKCYEHYFGEELPNLELYKDLAALQLAALLDLYLRPGLYSLFRNLFVMGPRLTFTQNLLARKAIGSFHDYCVSYLENRGILRR